MLLLPSVEPDLKGMWMNSRVVHEVHRPHAAPGVERGPMSEHEAGADRLLTVGEVAAAMRVSNMTVYRLIKAGELGAIRVGKNYRIRESDVNRYLSDRSLNVEGE